MKRHSLCAVRRYARPPIDGEVYGILNHHIEPGATDLKTLVYHTVPEGQNVGKTGMYKHTLRAVRYGMLKFYIMKKISIVIINFKFFEEFFIFFFKGFYFMMLFLVFYVVDHIRQL